MKPIYIDAWIFLKWTDFMVGFESLAFFLPSMANNFERLETIIADLSNLSSFIFMELIKNIKEEWNIP